MEIEVKPFEKKYAEQCADLLQYLWKEDKEGRKVRFNWAYLQNPNTPETVTAVIAVNEDDEVLGFRGYHTLTVYFGNQERRVAYIADTVVSPNARRHGILQKMTAYSFKFLIENNIHCISNLGPSWPPYYGYKKLQFEDLHDFTSRYKVYLGRFLMTNIFGCRNVTCIEDKINSTKNITFIVSNNIPDDNILAQIKNERIGGKIMPCRNTATLKWKATHPNVHYVFAYAIDANKELKTFMWFKTYGNGVFNLGLYQTSDKEVLHKCYKLFISTCKPIIVAAWDWAINDTSKDVLKSLHFHKIPYLNRIRKNPPAIVRTLDTTKDDLNWEIDNIDVRDSNNWVVDKFEGDSF